jgi:hypothetical protein
VNIRNLNYKKYFVWAAVLLLGGIAIVGIAKHVDAKSACPISIEVKRVQAQPGDGVESLLRRESNYDGRCSIDSLKEKFASLNGNVADLQNGATYVIPQVDPAVKLQ